MAAFFWLCMHQYASRPVAHASSASIMARSAKSKAKAAPKAKSGIAASPPPAQESPGAKRQRLNRRNLDEQVARLISANLPEATELQLRQHLVDGLSLVDRVAADKDRAGKDGRHLGTTYWRHIRKEYGIEAPMAQLRVKDDKQVVDPGLVSALQLARNPNAAQRTKSQLISWCASVEIVNQRSLVGLLKFLCELRPNVNSGSAQALLEVGKMVARLGLMDKFAEEPPCVRSNRVFVCVGVTKLVCVCVCDGVSLEPEVWAWA